MSRRKRITEAKLPAPTLNSVFGPAPVLESENSDAYDELLECVTGTIKPLDIVEDVWVRELVDLIWEVRRYQEYRSLMLKAAIPKGLVEVLNPFVNESTQFRFQVREADLYNQYGMFTSTPSIELANDWTCRKPEGIKRVNEVLHNGQMTMKDVEARAMMLTFDQFERFDRFIARLEARRDGLLAQIERRRATLAEFRRHVAREAENAEFETVDA